MKPSVFRAILLSAIVTAICAGQHSQAAEAAPAAPAAAGANRFAATIVPAERFEVRGVLVERHGSGGRPLILIPGLASGSWAWQSTIREFARDHVVYVLTLPGFDGRPAAGPNPFANARAAVGELIASRHLDKPVIVGHSIGATLGLAVAEDVPTGLGGVVAVDGMPVFPRTEDMPPDARAQMAERVRASMANATPTVFASQQQQYMRVVGVLDMSMADDLAKLSARSDPASSGQYAADDMALDLRPGLKTIQAPVLVISPFYDQDGIAMNMKESDKAAYYGSLMAGTPKLQVVSISPARHFVMFDQPQKFNETLRTFLKSL